MRKENQKFSQEILSRHLDWEEGYLPIPITVVQLLPNYKLIGYFHSAGPREITQGDLPGFPTQVDIFRKQNNVDWWCLTSVIMACENGISKLISTCAYARAIV